jgi:hypothetical protein
MLKEIVRAWGLDPEKVLVKETLSQPHRVLVDATNIEQDQTRVLSNALKKMLREELLTNSD